MSNKNLKKKGNSAGKQNFIIILAAIALFAIFTLINPGFASSGNLLTMAKSFVPYAILSLGVTFAIATGGIDLSIGTICFGSAVLAGALCKTGVTVDEGTLWLTIPSSWLPAWLSVSSTACWSPSASWLPSSPLWAPCWSPAV